MLKFIKDFFLSQPSAVAKPKPSKCLVLIMRHAACNTPVPNKDDRLSKKGITEASSIAYSLKNSDIEISTAVVSPARRALETYEQIQEIVPNCPKPKIESNLFHAYLEHMLDILKMHTASKGATLIIGHNPSVSEITQYLSGESIDFSTGSLLVLAPKKENVTDCLATNNAFTLNRQLWA
jgi:phosphohistidine phosphatase